jgi:hypothetical protein
MERVHDSSMGTLTCAQLVILGVSAGRGRVLSCRFHVAQHPFHRIAGVSGRLHVVESEHAGKYGDGKHRTGSVER